MSLFRFSLLDTTLSSNICLVFKLLVSIWHCTQKLLIPSFVSSGEPAVTRENNCLNAAKACNLNDTCKKYRSAYISPCTSRVSTAEVCNKRKCHKALRLFFDKASHFSLSNKHDQKAHSPPVGFPNDWYIWQKSHSEEDKLDWLSNSQ